MIAAEFEEVYDRTVRPPRAYLLRVCGDAALADDVVQETYYRFLGLEASVHDTVPHRPLLFRMATHMLYDHLVPFRREQRLAAAWPAPAPSAPRAERHDDLTRVFGELEPRQRSLLWLAHVEGFSHAEVAEALGVKEASVRVLLFRARRELAKRLRERAGPVRCGRCVKRGWDVPGLRVICVLVIGLTVVVSGAENQGESDTYLGGSYK